MAEATLTDADVSAVKETLESFSRCLEAQDFPNWVRYWTDDGTLMPPGHPRVVGHEALVNYMRSNFGDVKTVELSQWNVYGAGSFAVVMSNVGVTSAAGGKPPEIFKQMIVLSKESGDRWQVKAVIFNAGT